MVYYRERALPQRLELFASLDGLSVELEVCIDKILAEVV